MQPQPYGYAAAGTVNHVSKHSNPNLSLCGAYLVETQDTRRFPSSHDCATCRRKLKAQTKRNGRTAA